MASSRRTYDTDNITLRTVFAKNPDNTNVPALRTLTADGLGGAYWAIPSSLGGIPAYNQIITSAGSYTADLSFNKFRLLAGQNIGMTDGPAGSNQTTIYGKSFSLFDVSGDNALSAFTGGVVTPTVRFAGEGGIQITADPATNTLFINGPTSVANISTGIYGFSQVKVTGQNSSITSSVQGFGGDYITATSPSTLLRLLGYNDIQLSTNVTTNSVFFTISTFTSQGYLAMSNTAYGAYPSSISTVDALYTPLSSFQSSMSYLQSVNQVNVSAIYSTIDGLAMSTGYEFYLLTGLINARATIIQLNSEISNVNTNIQSTSVGLGTLGYISSGGGGGGGVTDLELISTFNQSPNLTNLAIGYQAGNTAQQTNAIAIGIAAGSNSQGDSSVAIGNTAGYTMQGNECVAIGLAAGANVQDYGAVAVGGFAGYVSQSTLATAVGGGAGNGFQGFGAVAMGGGAGYQNQGDFGIGIGFAPAFSNQQSNAIAIGSWAGASNQGFNSIAIGSSTDPYVVGYPPNVFGAGALAQGSNAIAIGTLAGTNQQADYAIALGWSAGLSTQGAYAIAMGWAAGSNNQTTHAIAIGSAAGYNNQNTYAVALGYNAAYTTQGNYAIAIGPSAATSSQGDSSIAIGTSAGSVAQGVDCIAIGDATAFWNQADGAISIGTSAGFSNQFSYAIAIGYTAGLSNQNSNSIAIGNAAGIINQNYSAVAIGYQAGYDTQGSDSIAIGAYAGQTSQAPSSIVISGLGSTLNAPNPGFYVAPLRDITSSKPLSLAYNPIAFEVGVTQTANVSSLNVSSVKDPISSITVNVNALWSTLYKLYPACFA